MKILKTGKEARESLKRGIDKVADAVKITLGPSGRNVIIGRKFESPLITNDGVSVAKSIVLDDEVENLAADIVKEVGKLTDDAVGDGTTTATVLLQAIVNEGFNRLASEGLLVETIKDPILVKKEIDAACERVVAEIKKVAKPIKTKKEIEQVAFVSVENKLIAKIIAELFDRLGKDGIVRVEDGSFEIESEVVEGIEIGTGYYAPYMANTDSRELILNNIKILVTNNVINRIDQVAPIAGKLAALGIKEAVIVAEDVTKEVQDSLVVNKLKGNFTIHAIRPTWFTNKERYEDLAIKFGAIFIDKDKQMLIQSTEVDCLGSASKVVADKDKTIFIGGSGDTSARIKELKAEFKRIKGEFDKKKIEERISSLSNGIGIIRVGASSDREREYWRLKVIDAVGATKAALDEGVVHGGGMTLKAIAEKLPKNILTESLKAPYNQIMENAGVTFEVGEDIIDPAKITRISLQNACSLAGIILTTEIANVEKNEINTRKDN